MMYREALLILDDIIESVREIAASRASTPVPEAPDSDRAPAHGEPAPIYCAGTGLGCEARR